MATKDANKQGLVKVGHYIKLRTPGRISWEFEGKITSMNDKIVYFEDKNRKMELTHDINDETFEVEFTPTKLGNKINIKENKKVEDGIKEVKKELESLKKKEEKQQGYRIDRKLGKKLTAKTIQFYAVYRTDWKTAPNWEHPFINLFGAYQLIGHQMTLSPLSFLINKKEAEAIVEILADKNIKSEIIKIKLPIKSLF